MAPVAAPCPDWLDKLGFSVGGCATVQRETVELARADGPLGRRAPLKRGAKGRQLERWRAERRIWGGGNNLLRQNTFLKPSEMELVLCVIRC